MRAKGPRKKPDHHLHIFFDEQTREIHIEGNQAGLEYLAQVCRSVIGQAPGPNHWHLSEAFETLDPPSLDVIICYREAPEGRDDRFVNDAGHISSWSVKSGRAG